MCNLAINKVIRLFPLAEVSTGGDSIDFIVNGTNAVDPITDLDGSFQFQF